MLFKDLLYVTNWQSQIIWLSLTSLRLWIKKNQVIWLTHSTWYFQSWCQIKTVEKTQLNQCNFTFFRSDSICRCMDWISRICVVTIFFAFFKYQYCSISPFSRQKLGTNGITAVIDCQFFWRPKMNERFYTYNYVPTYQLPVDASYI